MKWRRISSSIAGVVGVALGYVAWQLMFAAFQSSIEPRTYEELQQSQPFIVLVAVPAVCMVIGFGFLLSFAAGWLFDAVSRRGPGASSPAEVDSPGR